MHRHMHVPVHCAATHWRLYFLVSDRRRSLTRKYKPSYTYHEQCVAAQCTGTCTCLCIALQHTDAYIFWSPTAEHTSQVHIHTAIHTIISVLHNNAQTRSYA